MGGGIALFLFSIALSAMFKMSSDMSAQRRLPEQSDGSFQPFTAG